MITAIDWDPTYRLIASKYPTVSVYDRIVDTKHFAALLEVEALTNPRMREEAGDARKVRARDAIGGPGTTPIMASFAYSGPSRFTDGSFGVYYAAHDEATAIAESQYWTQQFLAATSEPSIDVDKRVYVARIDGTYEDIRPVGSRSPLYSKTSYERAREYGRTLYEADAVDGIVYRSVRRPEGECVCAFRPRLISHCRMTGYVQFRWDGTRIVGVARIAGASATP